MTDTERRHPENALLREKIDHIQHASEQLHVLAEQVQAQTVAWARQGKVADLPSAELASNLSATFQQQRAALAQIQEQIKGVAARDMTLTSASLITEEELAALRK